VKWLGYFLAFGVLVSGCGRPKPSPLTPTVGEMCKEAVILGDITYLENDKVCVTMYQVKRHDEMDGWTFVDVIGLDSQGLFRNRRDAEVWAHSQPYVRPAWQVR